MAEKIRLVQGDNLPYITLTLTDSASGAAVDLSGADTVVRVYFRAVGGDTILSTLTCSKVSGGSTGVVRFNFPNNTLNVEPGSYEGEVEIDFGGTKQTVYEVLKFTVRSQFA
jgi:hypothetical protein